MASAATSLLAEAGEQLNDECRAGLDETIERGRHALTWDEAAAAWAEVETTTLELAVALALGETAPISPQLSHLVTGARTV